MQLALSSSFHVQVRQFGNVYDGAVRVRRARSSPCASPRRPLLQFVIEDQRKGGSTAERRYSVEVGQRRARPRPRGFHSPTEHCHVRVQLSAGSKVLFERVYHSPGRYSATVVLPSPEVRPCSRWLLRLLPAPRFACPRPAGARSPLDLAARATTLPQTTVLKLAVHNEHGQTAVDLLLLSFDVGVFAAIKWGVILPFVVGALFALQWRSADSA